MDRDANLDEEVDHSFFDSDCEGIKRSSPRPRTRPASSGKPGSAAGEGRTSRSRSRRGQGAAETGPEDAAEDRARPGSSASSAPASTSASPSPPASPSPSSPASNSPSPPAPASPSSSSSSSGKGTSFPEEPQLKTTGSPNSSADEAGSSEEGQRDIEARPSSQRSVPGNHTRSNEAADSDPDLDIVGSKLDCSSSSSSGKQSLCAPACQRKSKSSSKSRKGHIKDSRQGKNQEDDAEGTVTDVTALSSPDSSPIHTVRRCKQSKIKSRRKKSHNKQENISQEIYSSLDSLSCDRERGQGRERSRRQREAKSSNLSSKSDSLEPKRFWSPRHSQKILNDATDLNQLLKAMMHLERRELRKIVADFPVRKYKKNYTFSNEEAKRIDHENQRLLQELTRKATKPVVVTSKAIVPSPVRVYHSTVNRQREQERIERENLAFLKRLEAVKPTKELRRSNQLMDYQRQMSFMESSYSQQSRPSTRHSSRSSNRKNIHPVSNSSA
ncbi:cilia- and flagella-associated protein 97 isoform X1 [Carcharodon carcharias]|uniref:cilia- and flagella-associated protein 97 isoform X1 n=1 Tax=Carcharodon carcharias TaxID=13397 RepID=UPI001B7DF323|nr:cilia- and flagella-associated protein 97 isoform X1 [Carcharodon carcharias]